jgi:hypothetical protein
VRPRLKLVRCGWRDEPIRIKMLVFKLAVRSRSAERLFKKVPPLHA